jgi:hypothetical protein
MDSYDAGMLGSREAGTLGLGSEAENRRLESQKARMLGSEAL